MIQKQLVHLEVKWGSDSPWFFTVVYHSPQASGRILWEKIEEIAENINGPWCLGADFNSILTLEDTWGSSNLSFDTTNFINCIKLCEFNNLGFLGPLFTWQRSNVKRRLDRFLSNLEFSNRFVEAGVKHLPKLKSDHLPIPLDFQLANQDGGNKPFRFLAPWVLHEDYNNIVKQSWNNSANFTKNIATFIEKVKV
ncbi:hypothetical protein AHAS_Ahas16G0235500 [Arachis hypogaea]